MLVHLQSDKLWVVRRKNFEKLRREQHYGIKTLFLLQTDAHNYKIIGILKQLKFRLSLRHVSVHAGNIFRELSRA